MENAYWQTVEAMVLNLVVKVETITAGTATRKRQT
jgi:hypothetical protein